MNFFFRRRRSVAATASVAANSNAHPQPTATQKRMTDIFVERVSNAADIATIILGSLAAVAGLVAWLSAKEDAARKDVALSRFQIESKERTAKLEAETTSAQLELARLQNRIKPRQITPRFTESLEGKPSGKVEILFKGDSDEATSFAYSLLGALQTAGWKITAFHAGEEPDTSKPGEGGFMAANGVPSGSDSGVSIATVEIMRGGKVVAGKLGSGGTFGTLGGHLPPDSPMEILCAAFAKDDLIPNVSYGATNDKSPPKGLIRIVIGPRF